MSEPAKSPQRAWWMRTLVHWHWISSAVCLLGMLLFALTGLTLNHAGSIEAQPVVVSRKAQLPDALRVAHEPRPGQQTSEKRRAPFPPDLAAWAAQALAADVRGREAEWSPDEIYVAMPRPGGEAWLRIDRASGEAEFEDTDRGWISYLNDLHKGRHTGAAWSWFIDAFALGCLVFTITGLLILQLHAGQRIGTWPLVGLGVVLPVLLALLFIH